MSEHTDSLMTSCMGEALTLYADRALLWQAQATLLISDLHLGKSQAFRQAGIALPSGHTQADLRRLANLLQRSNAKRLLMLGDVLHAKADPAPWQTLWWQLRDAFKNVRFQSIIGNHDRHLMKADLGIELLGESISEGPFCFEHAPNAERSFCISGHVHPVVKLPGLKRFPAFCFEPTGAILPAFSGFTGGFLMQPQKHRVLYVCAQDEIVAL